MPYEAGPTECELPAVKVHTEEAARKKGHTRVVEVLGIAAV